ncbi:tRNA-dihydrouridine(47) synthase [NAD(P)(+)]-like protein [Lunasporangiospora selenospora]|uniref:tRNA-dihydrouridine(47) synthase [NAD(P)(+)] n=1 Tax=Lunasporangiospora selenospora TaxID=979761 RepID=A0A9P6G016_9FUNG|nr:tRNA-dihydrouridine(47) synthase [NAD(P)(+)]-like protein [Lunasporangiospora selenospora]
MADSNPVVAESAASNESSAATPALVERRGIAPIKPEYLITKTAPTKEESIAHLSEAIETQGDAGRVSEEGKSQGGAARDDRNENKKRSWKDKHVKNDRKKRGGQTKDRIVTRRIGDEVDLCFKIAGGQECERGESCKANHDIPKYLAAKPKDLGDHCVNFDVYGTCRYGYKCRYLGAHLDGEGKLVTDQAKIDGVQPQSSNVFSHDLTLNLRHFKFEFKRSEEYLKKMAEELAEAAKAQKGATLSSKQDEANEEQGVEDKESSEMTSQDINVLKPSTETVSVQEEVSLSDSPDVPLRPCEKKKIDFRGKTYLAPLTTVGNLPFRRICKEYGVDITCGEMAMATNLLQGQKSEMALLRRHRTEDLFGVQLTGNRVDTVIRACDMINQVANVDFVDLNMGCPIDLVFDAGSGSGLMQSPGKVRRIVKGMQSVLDVPVTVKFRMAIYDKKPIGVNLTQRFFECGASLGTLHGRSRQQRYTKLADWDYISQCASVNRGVPGSDQYMPIFGNGDILGPSDYYRHLEEHKVDGCMIARGALLKPWIFEEIKSNRDWDISSGERFDMLKRFANYGLEHWGSDTQGVNQTRRFMLEWQSFLHRYVPVGLLEVLPQKINERPPAYIGRNDLETLMASPDVSDWIKLSEMILGPAPEAFRFDPKHKANSTNVEG